MQEAYASQGLYNVWTMPAGASERAGKGYERSRIMSDELKNCPNCESADIFLLRQQRQNRCADCGLRGPRGDMEGNKWNALPRRADLEKLKERLEQKEGYIESIKLYIRSACEELGCMEWDANLHLGDVVEKHLMRIGVGGLENKIEKLKEENAELLRINEQQEVDFREFAKMKKENAELEKYAKQLQACTLELENYPPAMSCNGLLNVAGHIEALIKSESSLRADLAVYEQKVTAGCKCEACDEILHDSDCAVHNEPHLKNSFCNCSMRWIDILFAYKGSEEEGAVSINAEDFKDILEGAKQHTQKVGVECLPDDILILLEEMDDYLNINSMKTIHHRSPFHMIIKDMLSKYSRRKKPELNVGDGFEHNGELLQVIYGMNSLAVIQNKKRVW
jgi:hypothetical protein